MFGGSKCTKSSAKKRANSTDPTCYIRNHTTSSPEEDYESKCCDQVLILTPHHETNDQTLTYLFHQSEQQPHLLYNTQPLCSAWTVTKTSFHHLVALIHFFMFQLQLSLD